MDLFHAWIIGFVAGAVVMAATALLIHKAIAIKLSTRLER